MKGQNALAFLSWDKHCISLFFFNSLRKGTEEKLLPLAREINTGFLKRNYYYIIKTTAPHTFKNEYENQIPKCEMPKNVI